MKLVASQPHYIDHCEPILEAMGEGWATVAPDWASTDWHMVASKVDADRIPHAKKVYVEHGSGQTYQGGHPGYPGGPGLQNVRLFVCPNLDVARRWGGTYPGVKTVVAGCPKMDPWHRGERGSPGDQVAAITWHWPCTVSSYSGTALGHYRRHLSRVVDAWRAQGWIVVGHGHPRAEATLRAMWAELGVEWWGLDRIFDCADILVADNTSVMWEFASLDRPVIITNTPQFRRNSGEPPPGGRFWAWAAAGLNVESWEELAGIDLTNHAIHDAWRDARRDTVRQIYTHTDGHAARRAADAILELTGG